MTPLESVLGCHDVLASIFDHLVPGRPDWYEKTEDLRRNYRRALVSAALTCTTLSHHALNVLWREIDSIHPLLRTLPTCKRVDSQFVLCGAISDRDWARFRLYAARVRAIVGSESMIRFVDPGAIHPSVWNFLEARCNGSPLLPRLHYLLALDLHLSETSALALLLSHSLRTLDILFALKKEQVNGQIAPHIVSSLLQTLPLLAPNLETFKCEIDIHLDHGYIEAFTHFARLKTLTIHSEDALDGDALRILSGMAALQDLTCTIDHSNSSALTLHPYTFQHLTGLNVMGGLDDLTAFMGACNFPSLTGLTLRVKEPPVTGEPVDSFAAICRRCNPVLLTLFTVGVMFAFTTESPRPSRILQYFEPVLVFSNIKSFNLSFFHAKPSIHDDDLARCGAAWRRLAHLSVSHHQDAPGLPDSEFARPTLSGLVDLARRCPHLESFRVPELDASVLPEPNTNTTTLTLGHGLRTLWLDNVVLPAPESERFAEAATVFDRVFPSIDLDDARPITSHAKEWGEFLGMLKGMRL